MVADEEEDSKASHSSSSSSENTLTAVSFAKRAYNTQLSGLWSNTHLAVSVEALLQNLITQACIAQTLKFPDFEAFWSLPLQKEILERIDAGDTQLHALLDSDKLVPYYRSTEMRMFEMKL
jgi:hypothetical protein